MVPIPVPKHNVPEEGKRLEGRPKSSLLDAGSERGGEMRRVCGGGAGRDVKGGRLVPRGLIDCRESAAPRAWPGWCVALGKA